MKTTKNITIIKDVYNRIRSGKAAPTWFLYMISGTVTIRKKELKKEKMI